MSIAFHRRRRADFRFDCCSVFANQNHCERTLSLIESAVHMALSFQVLISTTLPRSPAKPPLGCGIDTGRFESLINARR
jgi:hypothetical protein